MTEEQTELPPSNGPRSVLGCRVADEVQGDFAEFVNETYGNRQGAYGRAVEYAMREFMDNDRYARVDDKIDNLRETARETNAMVRRIITAEKEKGAFLEAAPSGNQAGDRVERENAVIKELARQCVTEDHPREFRESEVNGAIAEVANVASEPSKRDYRESFVERGLIEQSYSKYRLTDAGLRVGGWEVADA